MKLNPTPSSIDDLLQMKALESRTKRQQEIIDEISSYDLNDRKEADVREDLIAPLLKSIGYAPSGDFYIDREVDLKVGASNLQSDYGLLIYTRHHWIIEAKRPPKKDRPFNKKEILQGLSYAAHPDVDAALIVLCNGQRLTIYDREVSLKDSVFDVLLSDLNNHYDELRAWLSPWQVWFFERRRGLRSVERALTDARNPKRVDDFEWQVSSIIRKGKRDAQERSRQSFDFEADTDKQLDAIRAADPSELIEGNFFYPANRSVLTAVAETIAVKSSPSSFHTIFRVFPDNPREINSEFLARGLHLLMTMEPKGSKIDWLPSWLGGGQNIETAIEVLFRLCLTNMGAARDWQMTLLLAAALRRVAKILIIVSGPARESANHRYALNRFFGDETKWSQLVDSQERQTLIQVDNLNRLTTMRLLAEHKDKNGRLKIETMKSALKDLWRLEAGLLESVDYQTLRKEADLGDLSLTESGQLIFDQLGHNTLCYAEDFPRWKEWALDNLRHEIETIARLGSWSAKEWLGIEKDARLEQPNSSQIANRFMLGEQDLFGRICCGYGWHLS